MDIKLTAGDQIGYLVNVLNEEDRGNQILRIILKLSHDTNDEAGRIIACKVLHFIQM